MVEGKKSKCGNTKDIVQKWYLHILTTADIILLLPIPKSDIIEIESLNIFFFNSLYTSMHLGQGQQIFNLSLSHPVPFLMKTSNESFYKALQSILTKTMLQVKNTIPWLAATVVSISITHMNDEKGTQQPFSSTRTWKAYSTTSKYTFTCSKHCLPENLTKNIFDFIILKQN